MAGLTPEEIAEAIIDLVQDGDLIVRGRNAAGQYVFVATVCATSEEIERSKRLWNTERLEILANLFKGTDRSVVS